MTPVTRPRALRKLMPVRRGWIDVREHLVANLAVYRKPVEMWVTGPNWIPDAAYLAGCQTPLRGRRQTRSVTRLPGERMLYQTQRVVLQTNICRGEIIAR